MSILQAPLGEPASTAQPEIGEREIREQLNRILADSLFRNSRRYPKLLRYVVDTTLAGREDSLKERTLGVEVFGKAPDYDTNEDHIVRSTAAEVRKRLIQYQGIMSKTVWCSRRILQSRQPRHTTLWFRRTPVSIPWRMRQNCAYKRSIMD
jgi:hypothetical protein